MKTRVEEIFGELRGALSAVLRPLVMVRETRIATENSLWAACDAAQTAFARSTEAGAATVAITDPISGQSEREAFEAWVAREYKADNAYELTTRLAWAGHDTSKYASLDTQREWSAWQARAALTTAPEPSLAPDLSRVPFLIRFDDTDREDVLMIGERDARRYYEQISASWNAHLFVKIDSNTRDEKYPSAALASQSPGEAPPGEPDAEWCPYCTDPEVLGATYYDQTCGGCTNRQFISTLRPPPGEPRPVAGVPEQGGTDSRWCPYTEEALAVEDCPNCRAMLDARASQASGAPEGAETLTDEQIKRLADDCLLAVDLDRDGLLYATTYKRNPVETTKSVVAFARAIESALATVSGQKTKGQNDWPMLSECLRCKGAGTIEVQDTSRGPDGETFDAPCPVCAPSALRPVKRF